MPIGAVNFDAIRALFAYNMQPALDPPGQLGESLVLYQWHKDHDGAIDMPRSRNLADWTPVNNSFAVGVAGEFTLHACGKVFHIDVFVLVTHSETNARDPRRRRSVPAQESRTGRVRRHRLRPNHRQVRRAGRIDYELVKFLKSGDTLPDWLKQIARVSGTIYVGDRAIDRGDGQLADQRTWLGATFKAPWLGLNVQFAFGLQIEENGPKGFGFVFTVSGGKDAGIGAFIVYGSLRADDRTVEDGVGRGRHRASTMRLGSNTTCST